VAGGVRLVSKWMCGPYSWAYRTGTHRLVHFRENPVHSPVGDWRAAHSAPKRWVREKCVQRAPCRSAIWFRRSGFRDHLDAVIFRVP